MVRCMSWKMQNGCIKLSNLKPLVIVKVPPKDTLVLGLRNPIAPAKQVLDLLDAFPNTDRGLESLNLGKLPLQIRSGCDMVCMDVRFEDHGDLVAFLFDCLEDPVCTVRRDGLGCAVVVEDRVDYDSF